MNCDLCKKDIKGPKYRFPNGKMPNGQIRYAWIGNCCWDKFVEHEKTKKHESH